MEERGRASTTSRLMENALTWLDGDKGIDYFVFLFQRQHSQILG